jgi:ADP-ribosylglycohydrolase
LSFEIKQNYRHLKETIINSLKGVAIGDAFGIGIEFTSRPWILSNVRFDTFINVWRGGKNNILPGTYSDDTEHTIGVIEALLDKEAFSADLLLSKFKKEYETDKQQKGHPRDGHGSIEDWYTGKKTIGEVRESQASREDPGNAPVMRALPFAFIPQSNVYDYAIINADVTHPNQAARNASLLTILTAWHFLRENGESDDLIAFFLEQPIDDTVKKTLKKIDALPVPTELTEEDYILLHGVQPLPYISWDKNIYGLPCAAMKTALNVVYVMKHSTTAFDALRNSINMGGDVDSLASVCTAITAGKYGLDSLPSFLLDKTEGLKRLEILGARLYEKFSDEYAR